MNNTVPPDVNQSVDLLINIITSPISVSILTAITTVILTFWFYRLRDKIRALRGLKSEIEYNQNTAETLQQRLRDDNDLREDGQELLESLDSLHVSSFKHAKNNGVLVWLPSNIRRTIINHYVQIERVNQQIRQRSSIRARGRALANYDEMISAYNDFIISETELLEFQEALDEVDSNILDYWPLTLIL